MVTQTVAAGETFTATVIYIKIKVIGSADVVEIKDAEGNVIATGKITELEYEFAEPTEFSFIANVDVEVTYE